MIDVILFVTASTLSGSLLLLLIETAGRFFETKIGPGKIYLLLKISLLYFWIPMVFLAFFLQECTPMSRISCLMRSLTDFIR